MKRFLIVAALGAVLSACGAGRKAQWEGPKPGAGSAAAESPDALVAAGDTAWAERGDKAQLEAAIAAWEKATTLAPDDWKTHTKLSRAYYFLADSHLRKEAEGSETQLTTYEKGTAAGERAMAAVSPKFKEEVTKDDGTVESAVKHVPADGIEAIYWYASNLGKWSHYKGLGAKLGNKDKIKAAMTRAMELDEKYFYAGPHRYFGAFYAIAPSFAGGDMAKSEKEFKKAIEMAPNYVGTKVLYAAEYAKKKKDRALFDKLISEVLATPDDVVPELIPETKNEKEKAKAYQANADKLF